MATRFLLLQRPRRAPTISPLLHLLSPPPPPPPSPSSAVLCKVADRIPAYGSVKRTISILSIQCRNIHTSQPLSTPDQSVTELKNNTGQSVTEPKSNTGNVVSGDANANTKVKRKKLKGRRAVIRWVKHFRYKKKKEYERMAEDEKILYKLRKAERKEARFVEALRKIEPADSSEVTHDPEILTPEEHFYFLKMGQKCKNYVPVGRRGIFQGVILNMHLHWKKHQTLKVVVKTFTPEEVQEIAVQLARLSGGIVLEINEDREIIMYRGKNYSQPPTEIMSPRISLTRKKALDKAKHLDGLRAVRKYIPKLHQDLEDLQARMKREGENKVKTVSKEETTGADHSQIISRRQSEKSNGLEEPEERNNLKDKDSRDDTYIRSGALSESEDLSDIFETDSETEKEDLDRPLYLDHIDMFPSDDDEETEDLEESLRQISTALKGGDSSKKDATLTEPDEIDKIFLNASSLLKKRR